MVEILESGPKITRADVDALEERLGLAFPGDYRDFLVRYNGGRPSPRTFRVPSHPEEFFDVHYFCGLTSDIEAYTLDWNVRLETDFVKQHLVPIGGTDTSDLLLLKVDGDGGVFFWDSMAEERDSSVYAVASTFSDFLACLHEGPEV